MAKSYPIAVVRTVVMDRDGHILLGLRKETSRWECPGGKIEGDETVEDAARRETAEECGIYVLGHPEFVGFTNVRHLTKPRYAVELYLAFPEIEGVAKRCEEGHLEWRWVTPAEAKAMPLMPSAYNLVNDLLRPFLGKHREWPPLPAISLGPVS